MSIVEKLEHLEEKMFGNKKFDIAKIEKDCEENFISAEQAGVGPEGYFWDEALQDWVLEDQ